VRSAKQLLLVPKSDLPEQGVRTGLVPDTQLRTGLVPDTQVRTGLVTDTQVRTGLVPDTQVKTGLVPDTQVRTGLVPDTHKSEQDWYLTHTSLYTVLKFFHAVVSMAAMVLNNVELF